MGFNFGHFLEEAIANINPFDGGKTAATVSAARKRRTQPAVTVSRPNQPRYNQSFSQGTGQPGMTQQRSLANSSSIKPVQTPQINMASLSMGDLRTPKLFDDKPNDISPETWQKMKPEVRTRLVENERKAKKAEGNIFNPINVVGDVIKGGVDVAKGVGKIGGDMITQVGDQVGRGAERGGVIIGELNGQNAKHEALIQRQAAEMQRISDSFANRARNATNQADFDKFAKMSRSAAVGASDATDLASARRDELLRITDPRQTLVDTGMTALDIATLGKGKMLLEGVNLGAKVGGQSLKTLGKNTAITSAQGAGIGGSYGALGTAQDPNATLLDYAKNTGIGAAAGAGLGVGAQVALPVAGAATKAGIQAGTQGAKVVAKEINNTRPTVIARQHPEVQGFEQDIVNLQRHFDNTPDPVVRTQISKAITNARQQQGLVFQREVSRAKRAQEGGFAKVPFADDAPELNIKPTLQDALNSKSTKIKAKPEATQVGRIANSQAEKDMLAQSQLRRPLQELTPQNNSGQSRANGLALGKTAQEAQLPEKTLLTSKEKVSPFDSKVSEKTPIVNEGRRAIKQGTPAKYGLKESFEKADNVPQELKDSLGGFGEQRTVKSNKELWSNAQNRTRDTGEAYKYFTDNNNDEAVATGYALINKYMKEGNTKQAGDIAMTMAERALASGRQTQAYAMMKKLTPDGQIAYVARKVNKYIESNPKKADKIKWNDDVQKRLYKMAEDVASMPEGRARALKVGEMQRLVDDIFPSSLKDKSITVWKAGLLTSLRTHERNMIGNSLNLASEQIATAPGSLADRLMSLRTGKRTLVASTGEGLGSGAKYGSQIAKDQVKTGIDVTDSNLKMNLNHVTWGDNKVEKALKGYTETVFRTLGAEDKIFREAARKNSFYNQALAEAATRKLKGEARDQFVNKLVKKPTAKMLDLAEQDSGRATFTHDNVLGDLVRSGKQSLRSSKVDKMAGGVPSAVGDVIVPFTQVPTGVASQLYAYSPAKMAKSMYDIGKVVVTGDSSIQRQAAQGFGRSAVGTAVLGAGVYLSSKGLMTGQPEDEAERAQWEAEGKAPNSVKVGDKWYQLGSIGPQTLLILAGAQAQKDAKEGRDPVVLTAGNLGKNFKEQTFLQGMSSALDALDDPKRYGQSFVESLVTSTTPNIVKDVAKATDENQRNAIGIGDKLKQGIPGLSKSLPERKDSYGQTMKNRGIGAMIDLFNSNKEKDLPEAAYIDALRESTGLKEHVPSKADRKLTINGVDRVLTSQEHTAYQKYIGEKGKEFIGKAMNTPEFLSLDKEEQVKKIDSALTDINSAAKVELFGNTYKKNVPKGVAAVLESGGANVKLSSSGNSYLTEDLPSTLSTSAKSILEAADKVEKRDDKWKSTKAKDQSIREELKKWLPNKVDMPEVTNEVALDWAKYQKDFAAGKVSKLEADTKKKGILRDAFNHQLNKDERKLYKMSKASLKTAYENGFINDKNLENAVKVENQLFEAGLIEKRPLAKKLGLVSGSTGGRRGGRKSGGKGGKKSAKGKFDYKLNGFGGGSSTASMSKELYDILAKAELTSRKARKSKA